MKFVFGAAMLLSASLGFAGTIDFSGSGASGSIAPSGQTYTVELSGGDLIWGVPQYAGGVTTWDGPAGMIGLTITFTGGTFPLGSIDQTLTPDCVGNGVVMCDAGTDTPWATVVTGDSVTFTAPTGDVVAPGEDFFVNVPVGIELPSIRTAATSDTLAFNGFWTTVDAVPEPGSFGLLGAGLAGLMLMVRKRSRA